MKGEPSILKRDLREIIRKKLTGIAEAQRHKNSESARKLLEGQDVWKKANKVLFYAPMKDELDVWPLFEDAVQTKGTYLPRFVGDQRAADRRVNDRIGGAYVACYVRDPATDLEKGEFGIREPIASCPEIPLNRLDFVLVPGIAFDLQGRRLGRGKGYYDRLLADARGIICGVAFDEQIVEVLPVEPHDIHVNCILTPTRWIELRAARGF